MIGGSMLRIVETKLGKIEGLPAADPRITAFKGIPYAKPPVGELRFHAPVPAEKWEGTLKAYTFSPIPVQPTPYYREDDIYCREWSVDRDIPMGEDCLTLNVWTPAHSPDEKLPVYFWIYGGGFQTGFSAEMEFDGERIARRDIVVVTVNYRLNMFGFMAHPEITKENPQAASNFGLMDQRLAMEWVKDNIAAFGGDPENITIGGQSAGGGSVLNQILHGSKGIFKRAVCHSGMFYMPGDHIMSPRDLEKAEQRGIEFFEFCGAKSLADMRKFTTEELRKKWDEYGGFQKSIENWLPCKDGNFIKSEFFTALEKGELETVPMLFGYTPDEFQFEVPGPDGQKKTINAIRESVIHYQELADKTGSKAPNYCYIFDIDIPGFDNPGKFHSVDLWFWFETLAKCWRPFTGKHYDAARMTCDYLCNFIKTGNPNGKDSQGNDLPEWKQFNSKSFDMLTLKEKD